MMVIQSLRPLYRIYIKMAMIVDFLHFLTLRTSRSCLQCDSALKVARIDYRGGAKKDKAI
jgi:hypothetical protein